VENGIRDFRMTETLPGAITGLTDELFQTAVAIFLEHAYPAGAPPRVQRLLAAAAPAGKLALSGGVFEMVSDSSPTRPHIRYDLRIGWVRFPHLKMAIETGPGGGGPLFAVNAHDRMLLHACNEREAVEVQQLIRDNNAFKEKIERLWEAAGIPTFKAYLRRELRKRLDRT